MKSQKLLSLSMIVKDEEENLARCLESVKDIIDEIIVVDTGSEDNTAEIAKRFGAEVYYYPWSDDFSAARNYSLSKCSGKFILYLDADEILANESIQKIKSILTSEETAAYRCLIENTGTHGKRKSVGKYCRLFPNVDGIEFQGKVHEQIEDSIIKNNIEINESSIKIVHFGYDLTDKELKKKARRNLPLLLTEYETRRSSYYAYHLGLTYSILEEKEKAKEFFEIALSDSKLDISYKYYSNEYLANYYIKTRELEKAKEHLNLMFELAPNRASTYLLSSKFYAALRDFNKASMLAATAYELNESNYKDFTATVQEFLDPVEIIHQGLYLSVQTKNNNNFYHFIELYDSYAGEKFVEILKSLFENTPINEKQVLLLLESINDDNLSIVMLLLQNYTYLEIISKITEALLNAYNDNPDLLLLRTEVMAKMGKRDYAIEMLENKFELFTDNPAPAFYLMSYYLEDSELQKLDRPLEFLGKYFPNDPEVLLGLQKINEQIGILLN